MQFNTVSGQSSLGQSIKALKVYSVLLKYVCVLLKDVFVFRFKAKEGFHF